jgi:vacuolar-type H+-ATPase subunit F/Vma7
VKPVFIGDEVTAAGYRLAGLDARVAGAAEATPAFLQALREAPPLLLVTAECAATLPPEALDAALARLDPPVVVVPDAGNRVPPPDLLARVRAALGIVAPGEAP